jgi:outer membrane protein assembly factor BamB
MNATTGHAPWTAALRLGLLVAAVGGFADTARAHDWAFWRGPQQNGVSTEKDLPASFLLDPKDPASNLVWKVPYGCRSTPIVMNGRVYLNNRAGEGVHEQERVMCLDAATGKKLWEHRFNVFFTDIVSVRLGWTNLVGDPATGNVYWHGTQGFLMGFDRDGKVLWRHELTEEYGRISGYGGRLTSPVVDGDLVIMGFPNASWGDQAKPANRFLALNKYNGTPVWWSEVSPVPATYFSNPVVAVINGQRLLITGATNGGLYALQVRTGKFVWGLKVSGGPVNSSPVVDGTRVYICGGEENVGSNLIGTVVCVDAADIKEGKPKELWRHDGIKVKYTTPALHEGRLYVCDDTARMYCFDAKDGKQLWKFTYGRNARGSPVWADDKIYVPEFNSRFHILKPGPRKCTELHDQFFPGLDGTSDVEIYASPAVANGHVIFSTQDETYCIGKRGQPAKAGPVPQEPKETPASDGKVAWLQLVPADVVLRPGESATFKVNTFDAHGLPLTVPFKGLWFLPSPPSPPNAKKLPPALQGELTQDGKLTVSPMMPNQGGLVEVEAGGLSAKARVRVVPRLPYTQDFEKLADGSVPGGWVNAAGKFAVKTLPDGSKVLAKVAATSSPLLSRADAFIGPPTMTDYTIEADVMAEQKGRDLPDMGVTANRYILKLVGNTQNVRLTSWDAIPRIDQTISFPHKAGVWYRLKLTVDVQGDKAVARGKVWPRGGAEPKDWTVEVVDPSPNREGSPAVYGYLTGYIDNQWTTDAYFDNVRITPNKK